MPRDEGITQCALVVSKQKDDAHGGKKSDEAKEN